MVHILCCVFCVLCSVFSISVLYLSVLSLSLSLSLSISLSLSLSLTLTLVEGWGADVLTVSRDSRTMVVMLLSSAADSPARQREPERETPSKSSTRSIREFCTRKHQKSPQVNSMVVMLLSSAADSPAGSECRVQV